MRHNNGNQILAEKGFNKKFCIDKKKFSIKLYKKNNRIFGGVTAIKVNSNKKNRSEILELAKIFRVNVIDVGVSSLTMEITGGKEKIDSLVELLRKFDLREVIRTGRVATLRGTLIEGKSDGEFQYQTKSDDDSSETFFESVTSKGLSFLGFPITNF